MLLHKFHLLIILTCLTTTLCKVFEMYSRDHFHDTLLDLPVGMRYGSVIAFYNDSCSSNLGSIGFKNTDLPSVEHLLMAKYEFSTYQNRLWYHYYDHLDLPMNLGINDYMYSKSDCECPIVAFIPASYADELGDDYLGNPNIKDIKIWNSEIESNFKTWVWKNMEMTVQLLQPLPFDYEITVNHQPINSYLSSKGDPWTESITIDAMQSHYDLVVFPGDTFYVSRGPELTKLLMQKRKDEQKHQNKKPTANNMNPTYMVHSGMTKLHLIEFEDGTWGFDDDRPTDLSSSFIQRRHSTTLMTHTRNLILPRILPATHPVGFIKIKMPPGLHERLKRFYRKWYHLKAEEGWDRSGTQLNFYHVKTHMISLDHDYHERNAIANDVIKPMLLDWAHKNGHTEVESLEFTAFYGIREYSRGASLRNHVDRVDTHVFSVILQIGQTGIDTPWPLQVIGFDGKFYDIVLEPGEMIFYEGHKLVHGRPYPFNGTRFANAFVHFKPNGWSWTTGKVWKDNIAQSTLSAMHMNMRDIYR